MFVPSCRAVLLASTGDPSANASAPGGTFSGSGWQYEGQWDTDSGKFLGTAVAPMFFLTAKHVGGTTGSVFVLNGFHYHAVSSSDCPDCDLSLWQVAETFPTNAPFYSGSGEVNKQCIVFGRGTQRGTNVMANGVLKGWFWGAADNVERWGQNIVSNVYTDQTNGQMLQVYFGAGKCDLSTGDSSGGLFIQNGSAWQLAGVNHAVDGPFSTDGTTNTQFDAALLDMNGLWVMGITNWIQITVDQPSSFYTTRVSANLAWINGVLGAASPVAPVASFSAAPTSGPWPLAVTFTDTSTGTLTNRFWDFGDGATTNTTANILTHSYGGSGTNTVSLTVLGQAGSSSIILTNYIAIGNEEAPATPQGLTITLVSANQVNLGWQASTNAADLGFVGYEVFRNGVQVNATSSTNFIDRNVAPSSNYCYTVAAYNAQRTASPPSDAVCTNTLATPGSLLGTYNGLVIQTNAPSNASSGGLRLVISKTGTFTAKLTMGGVSSSFRGQFDGSGNSTNTVTPHGANQLQVILHLDIEGQTEQITGTVSDYTFTSVLLADRAIFSRTNPCPQSGEYAITFEPPPGDDANLPSNTGTATFLVTSAGTGRMTGILGDGTKINVSAPVSQFGTWPLYEALYTKKQGGCIGWVIFGTNNALSATLGWYRPPMPKAKAFPLGFSTAVTITGR